MMGPTPPDYKPQNPSNRLRLRTPAFSNVGRNRGQIALIFVVTLSSAALLLAEHGSLSLVVNRHVTLPFQIEKISSYREHVGTAVNEVEADAPPLRRVPVHSYDVTELQREEIDLIRKLNETLSDFRFPAETAAKELRLPDYYFASKKALSLRTPSKKFRHLSRIYSRLFVQRKAVHISILGGSNSAGSGLGKSMKEVRSAYSISSYALRLERWLNKFYPPNEGLHTVHNFGRGGVGSCYFLLLFEKLTDPDYLGGDTDLFILETSVNDILRGDMACFEQLVTRISHKSPASSVISVHLTTGPEFLKACERKHQSTSSCGGLHRQPIPADPRNRSSYPNFERWCDKRQIVDKHRVLQIDMGMLYYMFCKSIPPFQHSRFTSEMSFASKHQGNVAQSPGKKVILDYISRADAEQVKKEVLLLTEGTYSNSQAYDSSVVTNYKSAFVDIEKAITSRFGYLDVKPGILGDLSLFSSDRIHIGRWGHLILTAEIATWLTWLSVSGYEGIENDHKLKTTVVEDTVWGATTFDMGYYNKRSQSSATNKHKARKGAKLNIHPLRAASRSTTWKLMDDSGMHKMGLITLSKTPQSISFKLPKFNGELHEKFTVRLGYLKSYVPQMANFSVILNETIANRQRVTHLTGKHEQKVSIFVDTIVGVVSGTNEIMLTVTSLPEAEATKVKVVGIYVTRSSRMLR